VIATATLTLSKWQFLNLRKIKLTYMGSELELQVESELLSGVLQPFITGINTSRKKGVNFRFP
jgi:hypothetical protein